MDKSNSSQNRRRFQRVLFEAPVNVSNNSHSIETSLVDISLKGALVKAPENWQLNVGAQINLTVVLDDESTVIHMQATVAHTEADQVGCKCDKIDMDSITHLRRLVELNVGDASLLDRDLQALG